LPAPFHTRELAAKTKNAGKYVFCTDIGPRKALNHNVEYFIGNREIPAEINDKND
jgi:hypothetical protein